MRVVAGLCGLAALLSCSLISAAPDSIGRQFIYTLKNGINGSVALYAADDQSLPQCNLTHDNSTDVQDPKKMHTFNVSHFFEIVCSTEVSAIMSAGIAVSALLPVDVLGTQYISTADYLVVTATADGTEIEIQSRSDGNVSVNGIAANSYKLKRGESCYITHSDDLIGTKIKSNKPVSALNQQLSLPALKTWGSKYLLTELSNDRDYRVVGENATCRLGGRQVEFTEGVFVTNRSGLLDCDRPVLVTYFAANAPVTTMPSLEQFPNSITVSTPEKAPTYNLYVQIQTISLVGLIINDQSAAEFPNRVNSTTIADEYTELHFNISRGRYAIYHKNPTVILYAYMMDPDDRLVSFAPIRLPNTGEFCKPSVSLANDGIDNDCDSSVDEELLNGKDDDGDGKIDEDIATNDFYGDTRDNSGKWPMSYTILIIVLLVIVLAILIALCHWRCKKCSPAVKDDSNDLMVSSYDSRAGTAPPRYRLSGSRSGFTISRG